MAEAASGPDVERLSLSQAVQHLLEECRMVLPGIQALFGFQLIVVFHDNFSARLSHAEQSMHLASIGLLALPWYCREKEL